MVFRVGINLGDVMVTDDNLFGDAVNIAARLEAEAQPAGIFPDCWAFKRVRKI